MTALTRYQKLEGSGLWRPEGRAQRRDVAVRLGDTSLIIIDSRSGTALSHWTLAALSRANPGRMPARYHPGEDGGGESLETDDELLIEAIETIRAALAPPQRGRWLRNATLAALAMAVLAGVLALPQVLVSRGAGIVPQASRAHVGRLALEDLTRIGSPARLCAEPAGRQVMTVLRNRVLGPDWRVVVVDGIEGFESGHLPGRMVVLSRDLVERLDSPEALAGWLVAEELSEASRDPMLDVLRHAGTRATLTLLSTGSLPDRALTGYLAARLIRPASWPDAGAVARRLGEAGISTEPFAGSLPPAAARLAAVLLSAPEASGGPNGQPLLTDGEWLTLQAICQS